MSLEHILMAMLKRPASGYDLKAEFESGAKFFWSAEFGQIYPTLQALEKKGWLKSQREPSEKGPPRKVYQRTELGDREFHAWLRSGPAIGTERFAWIAQLLHLGELNDLDETLRFLESLHARQSFVRDVLRNALSGLDQLHAADPGSMPNEEFHEWLALQFGLRAIDSRVQWCEEALEVVRQRKTACRKKESSTKRSR